MRADKIIFVLACVAAGLVPFFDVSSYHVPPGSFPGWPTYWEGRPLRSLPLGPVEQRFAADFPGRIGRFSDGQHEIVMRWISSETRRLHPASDCFRGAGYAVSPRALMVDDDGARWGRFEARRGSEVLDVRERLHDLSGHQWTDVSAWYWAAVMGRSDGPWWAITVAANTRPP